jgi:adenylate cyclase
MPSYSTPEDEFRALMSGDHPRLRRNRRLLARLPSDPRCKTCNAPFGFPGSIVSRAIGRPRFPKSPGFCQICFNWLIAAGIRGADIEMTMLFMTFAIRWAWLSASDPLPTPLSSTATTTSQATR